MNASKAFAGAAVLLALTACDNDPQSPPSALPLGNVVVLNGVDPKGVTVLQEMGTREAKVTFDPFDGASFVLRGDTVASTSSKASGDLLHIGYLQTATSEKVQLPPASNPAGVQFGRASSSAPRLYVALRDVGQVAEVPLPRGNAPIVLHPGAGVCPVDVIISATAIWALDANQRCASDYATLGPSRMVPLPGQGSTDTVTFGTGVVGAQRAFVVANNAYVMSAGNYFSIPGAFTKVDLATRASTTLPLPADRYAASLRMGKNGRAYVTAFPPYPAVFARVYAIDPATMAFVGTKVTGEQHLRLIKSTGSEASCFAATADAAGNVYCLENSDIVSTLYVFNAAGDQIRSMAAGSPAFDITLR